MVDQDVRVEPVSRKTQRRRLLPVLAVLSVLVAIGVATWILTRSSGTYVERRPKTSGPPVPWPTMLALADQEAHKVANDAILINLYVDTIGLHDTWQITESLEIYFGYARPEGKGVDIIFEDASPTTTLRVEEKEDKSGFLRVAYHHTQAGWRVSYEELTKKVNISPREAIQRTWSQVTQVAEGKGISDPHPEVFSIILSHEQLAWKVFYIVRDPAVPTPDWDNKPVKVEGSLVGEFAVDARSGEITSSEYRDKRGTIVYEDP